MIEKMLEKYSALTESALEEYIAQTDKPYAELINAMRYSLFAGGKRLRPALLLEFYRQFDDNYEKALPMACAFEMVHTYSLIHDDLPLMDDDDLRRGKPSCHIAYSESTALLAGDALQALAFETALSCDGEYFPQRRITAAARELAHAAGVHGMAGGQMLDLAGEGRALTVDELRLMENLKTGAMITGAARAGCILAGAAAEDIVSAEKYAAAIGLAFQITDDILDVTSNEEELGKPIGSDSANQKSTYVTLLGMDGARAAAAALTGEAKSAAGRFRYGDTLCELAEFIAGRRS